VSYYRIGLTNIAIPASVTSIGKNAFYQCTNLAAITVDTNNPAYSSVIGVLFNQGQTTLVEYPDVISFLILLPLQLRFLHRVR
jgi:hypothetical protein